MKRTKFKFPKYEYTILKNQGLGLAGYGWTLSIFKNGKQVAVQGAFGSVSMAEIAVRDYILFWEFNIEKD